MIFTIYNIIVIIKSWQKRLTVFQRLGKLFGPQGPRTTQSTFNQYKFSKKDLLKTTDKAEFDAAKLQAQQTAYSS